MQLTLCILTFFRAGPENDEEKLTLINENKRLKEENEILKLENDTLLEQIQELKAEAKNYDTFKSSVQKIFTPGQIRKLYDPCNKIVHWDVKDIAHAIALHAAGPRAYRT